MAKTLCTNRSQTIGFLTDEIVTTPHAVEIVQNAQDTAWNHGKFLLLVNTEGNDDVEQAAIDMMLERQVEGLSMRQCIIVLSRHRPAPAACRRSYWIASLQIDHFNSLSASDKNGYECWLRWLG